MESKGLHVSMKKTKFMVSELLEKPAKYPCAVRFSGAGNNSI